jgi:hypothetical protein
MFRTVFPSIIKSLRLYTQHQVYVIHVLWLPARDSKQPQNLYDIYLMLYNLMDGKSVRNMQNFPI